MKCIAILILIAGLSAAAARADDAVPAEWQACKESADCTYVINSTSCATLAVNKKFTEEATAYISKTKGDGRAVGMEGGNPRCLNQPEAYCAGNTCQMMVHPE